MVKTIEQRRRVVSESRSPRRRFFDAGMEILALKGYGSLKLTTLCRHLGVTTGSFYHSFENWQDFTVQFLEAWYHEGTLKIIEMTKAEVDPIHQVEMLLRASMSVPHEAEAAIRVWAGINPVVRKFQDDVDSQRLEIVTEAFERLVGDLHLAARLAKSALYALIGYEQAGAARDLEALELLLRSLQDEAIQIMTRR